MRLQTANFHLLDELLLCFDLTSRVSKKFKIAPQGLDSLEQVSEREREREFLLLYFNFGTPNSKSCKGGHTNISSQSTWIVRKSTWF